VERTAILNVYWLCICLAGGKVNIVSEIKALHRRLMCGKWWGRSSFWSRKNNQFSALTHDLPEKL